MAIKTSRIDSIGATTLASSYVSSTSNPTSRAYNDKAVPIYPGGGTQEVIPLPPPDDGIFTSPFNDIFG